MGWNQLRSNDLKKYRFSTVSTCDTCCCTLLTINKIYPIPTASRPLNMSSSTNSAVDDVKSGLKGIHGIGESIRGNINNAVDHAAHDTTGEAKNQAIANKGQAEMRQGEAVVDKHSNTNSTTTTTVSVNISASMRTLAKM